MASETLNPSAPVTTPVEQQPTGTDPLPVQTPPVETPKEVVDPETHHKVVSGFQKELQKAREERAELERKLREAELKDMDEADRLRAERDEAVSKLQAIEAEEKRKADREAYKDVVLELADEKTFPNASRVLRKVMARDVFPVQGETQEEILEQLKLYEEALGGVATPQGSVNESDNPAHQVDKSVFDKIKEGDTSGLSAEQIKKAMLELATQK